MSKPVLFVTGLGRSIDRSENIHVLYDAYKGKKKFMSMNNSEFDSEVNSGKYGLMVIDIFPLNSPGKTIMLWHSIQGGKYIGLDQRDTYYKPEYANLIDCIVSAGHGGSKMWNRCTGVPESRIKSLGMPRTDRYFGKKKGDGHTVMADKKAYLFAPTFRTMNETPFPMIDWQLIDNALADDEIMVVKAHPYGFSFDIKGYKHIVEADKMLPSVNYLYDADVVITDYSSIIFDAYLLGKPAVLFEKNPGYVNTRGMYMEYPGNYCSFYVNNETALIDMVRFRQKHPWLTDKELNCIDFVADACDGDSCKRICELIDEMKGD